MAHNFCTAPFRTMRDARRCLRGVARTSSLSLSDALAQSALLPADAMHVLLPWGGCRIAAVQWIPASWPHAQALRTRDPEVLRLAQQNIAARRAGLRTPIGATPGSFETPGASILRGPFGGEGMTTYLATPASTPVLRRGPVEGQRDPLGHTHPSGGDADGREAPGEDGPDGAVRLAPPMSLDRCP